MPAKKNIIREQRKLIRNLKTQLNEQNKQIRGHASHIESVKEQQEMELGSLYRQSGMVADSLKKHFNKELTWLALCDDPDSQFQKLKGAIKVLRSMAKGW